MRPMGERSLKWSDPMRRHLALALALTLMPDLAPAQSVTAIDWQLLAIDGKVTDMRATLRIEEDGTLTGFAPCNRWTSSNGAAFPALQLRGIRATRMACDKLEDEKQFFNALSQMTTLQADGAHNLVLTGPDGRTMEFVIDPMNSLTTCKTCPPKG